MAFNPFTSFRKYQRFWMATVLLLCMVTFVLCTGVGGDLSQRILDKFRKQEGSPLARVNGRNVFAKELTDLKEQRNLANEFMNRCLEVCIKNIHDMETSEKLTLEQRQKELPKLLFIKSELEKRRFVKSRYFGSGVKLDDLVDFMVWQHEADRLGVKLQPDHVWALLNAEMFSDHGIFSAFNRELLLGIIRDLRATSQRIPTEAVVSKALNDEFRVRIAQLALEYADPGIVRKTKERFQEDPEVRIPLSPAMLWDSFKVNRSEFDVTLLPVEVDDFLKQVPQPTEAQLKGLFEEGQKVRYDPTSPKPGFEIPASLRAELVIGDPKSPRFKQWSKAAILLEATPPAWIPTSPLTTLVRYVGGPLALEARLQEVYESSIQNPIFHSETDFVASRKLRETYLTAPLNEPGVYQAMASKLAGAYPEAAASWIAGYAQPGNFATAQLGFTAFGPVRQPNEIRLGLAKEVRERAPLYATIVASGAAEPGFQSVAMLEALRKERYFPLEVVQGPLTAILEHNQAKNWVHANMNALRKKLNEFVGNKAKYERELKNNLEHMGLERRVTKDFYNRFTIDKAPELQPLAKAFEKDIDTINMSEGRNLHPESMLKEGDFYKLLFDATESFSAASSTYKAKPWPPVVTPKKGLGEKDVKKAPQVTDVLFERAEKPMLFWKIEDKGGKIPETIDLVKDRVERAWKSLKAREDKALPKAKEIADLLQKSEEGFGPVLALQALELKRDPISLRRLAAMYTKVPYQRAFAGIRAFEPGERDYAPFTLPKDVFVYPRDDMDKEIIGLRELKKPIEIGDRKLDEFNKALFDAGAKTGRVVQILTNKPQSVFYVACVTAKLPALPNEFHSVMKFTYRSPALQGGSYVDHFFDRAFDQAGKEFQRTLISQLRAETDSAVVASADERDKFDANEAL